MILPDDTQLRVEIAAMRRTRRHALIGVGLALALLSALAVNGYLGNLRAASARAQVLHSLQVLRDTLELEGAAARMEAAQRGYLVNGDRDAISERDGTHAEAMALLARLRTETADNRSQLARWANADRLLAARYAAMRRNQQVAEARGLATAQARLPVRGDESLQPLRDQLRAARAHEDALLARRTRIAARDTARVDALLVAGTAAVLTLLVLASLTLLRVMAQGEALSERLRSQATDVFNLFRLSRDLICVASMDGYFLRLNPAWERTLGIPRDELLARPFLDFVHPDDIEATRAETAALASGNETVSFENRYRSGDGRWRWLLWNASADARTGLVYATARDITERKHAEQRIDALNLQLTARSQALEAANKELESFSYSVSHDLRAPLRHIDGYARMLAEDAGDRLQPEDRRYLATITESVRRMGALIDDLLSLSRYGRKPLERQPVDMAALARESLRDLPAPLPTIRIGSLPVAEGDPALLRQVWSNLLSNAVKYSAPRGEHAQVDVDGELVDGLARYRVRDNGVGFDMRHAGKLFGVFQRLHGEDRFEGTGVGLAIVQRVVHRHGGAVRAEAQPERGATFTFELPVAEVAA